MCLRSLLKSPESYLQKWLFLAKISLHRPDTSVALSLLNNTHSSKTILNLEVMKPKYSSRPFLPTLILVGSLVASFTQAADQIWNGLGGDAEWSSVSNWVGDLAAPGSTSGTTSPDIATFDSAISNSWGDSEGNPILITPDLNLRGINFTAEAGSYFIGGTGGSSLLLTSGGSIQILSTLTASGVTETVNAPLVIQGASGTYTLANNSADSLSVLNIGGSIDGGDGGATLLTLAGINTGTNIISGDIANGAATTLGIIKTGVGSWNLGGVNTHTGVTTVSAGKLISNNLINWKSNVTIASGATFNWNVTNFQQVADTAGNYTVSGAGLLLFSGGYKMHYGNSTPTIQFNLSVGGQLDIQEPGTIVEFGYTHNSLGGNLGSLNIAAGASFYSSDAFGSIDALTGAGRIGNAYNAGVTLDLGVSNTTSSTAYGVTANTAEFSGVITGPDSYNNVLNGILNIRKYGTGTQILSGANTYTGTTTVNGGVLQIGSGGTSGSLGTGNVTLTSPGSLTLKRSDAYSYSGVISGSGSFTHAGTGTTTLAGTNTYSGDTTVTAGTLKLSSANASNETSTVTVAAAGATLSLDFAGTDTVSKLFIGSTQMADGVYKSTTNPAAGIAIPQITGLGTLTVGSGAASSNFASWANDPTKGNIPGALPTGDFDNDGLTNLVEYALGKNPRISSQPAGVLAGNVITYTKGADAIANGDVSWVIETSTTLETATWTPQVTQPAADPAATISYTLTPGTPTANFARLKITQN
jgi:autotransporter-associated beta strand protein